MNERKEFIVFWCDGEKYDFEFFCFQFYLFSECRTLRTQIDNTTRMLEKLRAHSRG